MRIQSNTWGRIVKKGMNLGIIVSLLTVYITPQHAAASSLEPPFRDISNSYAKEAIVRLYNKGIVRGTTLTTFEPGKKVTRAELAKMMVAALRLDPTMNDLTPFKDLKEKDWYYGDISALLNLGIVQGRSENYFAPKSDVTREEAAALMVRMLKSAPNPIEASAELPYIDHKQTSKWAWGYISQVTQLGFMQGDSGAFRPNDSLTRAEAAVLLDRILQAPAIKSELNISEADPILLGWQYDSTTAEYEKQVLDAGINTLSPRWYFLDETEVVQDHTDQRLLTFAKRNKLNIWGMVGNRANAEMTHRVLSNAVLREATVSKLVDYAKKYELAGLNIDFENVSPEEREYLTLFMTSLYSKLTSIGVTLSIDVSPDLGTSWTAAFDYKALGEVADYVVLMGYEEHWNGSSTAGSVASIPWLEYAVQRLQQNVPKDKIIAALPTYTRNWSLSSPQLGSYDISLKTQGEIYRQYSPAMKWNSDIAQYTLTYTSQGISRGIWAEDSRSLSAKTTLFEAYDVAGYAFWYMGSETSDVWTAMNNARQYAAYSFGL
ncbi:MULTISPECIES: S-layer homology domain-containing protein [unclassified Paenibacillus]|uniref:S-layer homology domain-containing protein n=1 Tax=unclassified Paenibacillus TaxID=185978 RepID=UPI0008964EC0|nr:MULTISPECIES: S-layer homology domain-containing protein [unclassified Paenibacillus]SDW12223.1 Spore germination protein YaaH [Paenibacillus sp. PDC88]